MKNICLFLIIGLLAACSTDGFDDLNKDTKNPSEIPGEPLVTNAFRNLGIEMQEVNVNRNVFRLYAQYWAQCTYPDESQYNMVARTIPDNMWREMYRDILSDLHEAKRILGAETFVGDEALGIQANKLAIIDVIETFCFTYLVDVFGDATYTDAFNSEIDLPSYDDGASIYAAEIAELQSAISSMNASYGSFDGLVDPYYSGNVGAWKTFANSLLLKLAVRIQDNSLANTAIGNGVMTSNADNFACTFEAASPQTNPLWVQLVQSGRNDFVPANTVVDVLNDLNDPRRAVWFVADSTGTYTGGEYGYANNFFQFTHLSSVFEQPDLPGILMSYSETEFLLAEAAMRGANGNAGDHYELAIRASFEEWGAAGVDDYLAQADVAFDNSLRRIGVQKWLAMFNNGFEGWTTYRIFDFTDLMNAAENFTVADIPSRFIFPIEESTLNGDNKAAAAAKYNNDSKTAKVFWDKN